MHQFKLQHFSILLLYIITPIVFFACQNTASNADFSPANPVKKATAATTQFELLAPERTGIQFVPSITDEYRYNFIADPYIYNGGGVGILDVNNDGLQDLFFTARLQPCRLYLNKGGMHFEDISEKAGLSKHIGLKTGIVIVDINADGWQDVYVTRTWFEPIPERRNLLFINNKDNTFSEQAAAYGLDDISASQHANFFDYDGDGDLDCYVLNHPTDFKTMNNLDYSAGNAAVQPPRNEYESDRLFQNNGPALPHFTDISQKAGIYNRAYGLSTLFTDFDADGRSELFVGNDFVMPDFLYQSGADNKFINLATLESRNLFRHSSNHTMGADAADLNRDGLPDLVTLDMLAEPWGRRQRLMSTMQLPRDRQMQAQGYGRQVMRNVLQLSDGPGNMSELGQLAGIAATDWSWAPLIADFDNDGWRDIFISNGIKRDLNDLDFFLYTADSINKTGGVNEKRFASFEDYVKLMPSHPVHNYMFQNTGSLPYADVSDSWGFTQKGFSNGAAYADLDNDGDLDLITNNLEAAPSLYENKATNFNTNHWLQIKCKGTALNPMGIGAKIRVYVSDNEGNMSSIFTQDMTNIRGFYSSVEPIFQIGLGSFSSVKRIEIDWFEGRCQILENVAANQRVTLDISAASAGHCPNSNSTQKTVFQDITQQSGLNFKHIENEFEDFDREKLLPYRLSRRGPCMAQGDWNGDGLEDLFVGGASGQAGGLFLQKKEGNFQKTNQVALEKDKAHEDTGAVAFDADKDGDLDLLVLSGGNEAPANSSVYQDRLYLNDGKGQFIRAEKNLPTETKSGTCAAAHDYDGDGWTDLFIGNGAVPGRYPEAAGNTVWKNEQGVFKDVTNAVAPEYAKAGLLTDLSVGDFDGDGSQELVICGDWLPIGFYTIKEGKIQPKLTIPQSSGWWNCLLATDMDADGDLDLVAGNEGRNTRLQASAAAPLRLWAKDFDQNASIDPILCIADQGKYRPVAQRDLLVSQMPFVKKKFPRYNAYAQASITDIVPEKDLEKAISLSAQTFDSQWFENKGNGWEAHVFPWQLQLAPIHDCLMTDFNQDGKKDLLAIGNDYGPDIETYRHDAFNGCLLLGQGNGSFLPIPAAQSGFLANRDARRMAMITGKGGASWILVGNNNDNIQIFKHKYEN